MRQSLCEATVSPDEFERMAATLEGALKELGTLDEFVRWLESQPCIESVKLANHLVKTWPPLREITVAFKMSDGSSRQKTFDLTETISGELQFKGMHDQS